MTRERKYRDAEVREIFDRAASEKGVGHPAVPKEDGLTLAELQEIGIEVGVDPDRVADAALVLETRNDVRQRRRSLGLPVSVGRVIDLPRGVTDHEWEILVSILRETFGVRGKARVQGSTREWSHGAIQAFLEPTEEGHRFRIHTRKMAAKFWNRVGASSLAVGASVLTLVWATGESPVFLELVLLSSSLLGMGALGPNLLRLPRWARRRDREMEGISNRVRALIRQPLAEEEPES